MVWFFVFYLTSFPSPEGLDASNLHRRSDGANIILFLQKRKMFLIDFKRIILGGFKK